jgi:ABC-type transporter Mla maintaining outer membrane lipid asymmetry ATPase subunit MlaF
VTPTGMRENPAAAVPVVLFEHVSLAFDGNVVLRDVSFSVPVGHMTILIGASGVGKSVVLKLILGLLKPDSGAISLNGERIEAMSERQLMTVRDDIGMLFQESALFDSLTVADNVGYKLYEETDMPASQVVTHQLQDAFYVATHRAVSGGGQIVIVKPDRPSPDEATFVMLKDGYVYFEGSASALTASQDPYLQAFLAGWVPSLVA